MTLIEKLFGSSKQKTDPDEYAEIDISQYEESLEDEPAGSYLHVADLTTLKDIPALKKELYAGNMLIVNISSIKADKITFERAVNDLKDVVKDIHGDIVGLGDDYVVVTTTGVKISRAKLSGV